MAAVIAHYYFMYLYYALHITPAGEVGSKGLAKIALRKLKTRKKKEVRTQFFVSRCNKVLCLKFKSIPIKLPVSTYPH